MATMIIDSEGNVIKDEGSVNEPSNRRDRDEISHDYPLPRVEEVVSDSDLIRRERDREQIIIAQLLGYPLA